MVVRWRTNYEYDGIVRWGSSPSNLNQSMSSGAASRDHEFEITGLIPDTVYYYAVGDSTTTFAGGDSEHFFRTFPTPGAPRASRIWVLGDSGTADANAAAVRDAYYSYTGAAATDLWLMLGDNAYSHGSFEQYQAAVFDMYPDTLRQSPLYATRGNHEDSAADFYGQFTFPTSGEGGGLASGSEAYYSFDYANIHFICLDSDSTSRLIGGAMLTWLEADLATTEQDWIIAFWHHPPYTKGTHDSDDPADSSGRMFDMRENVLPILEDYGVDLVLSGHSHSYERSYLIDGHYGVSSTYDPLTMLVDGGNGRVAGTGAYSKTKAAHKGAVYVVAGSSGKLETGTFDHPVMFKSLERLGSVVIEVDDDRMDLSFLRSTGAVTDWFTMFTRDPGPTLEVDNLIAGQQATVTVAEATPGNNVIVGWSLTGAGPTTTPYGDVMLSPQINQLGPIAADALGQVMIPVNVPGGTTGLNVWVHSLELTGASTALFSNALALTIQ
jgi:acid phosphatase type 7